MLSHREKWINMSYFVHAIRCVNSIQYWFDHMYEICGFIDGHEFVDAKLHRFFINVASLCDKYFDDKFKGVPDGKEKRKQYARTMKTMTLVGWVFQERDKNAAHKDMNYIPNVNDNPTPKMKCVIKLVHDQMKSILPDKLPTISDVGYCSYDPLLFRYINGVTPCLEQEYRVCGQLIGSTCFSNPVYRNAEYRLYERIALSMIDNNRFTVVSEPESSRQYSDLNGIATIWRSGTLGLWVGMLYEQQNGALTTNATFDISDIWPKFKQDGFDITNFDDFLDMIERIRCSKCAD